MRRLRLVLRLTGSILFSSLMWLLAAICKLVFCFNTQWRYRIICRLMSIWGHGVAWFWGMRIQVEGTPPDAPFFLLSNHVSYTDIVLVCAVTPGWFVSKSEVASWPGIGPLTRIAHTIFINRETRRDVGRMNTLIGDLVTKGGGVGFFPEGTTSDGSQVLPFKPSLLQPAIDLNFPVTLAAICYQTLPGQPPAETEVAWYGDDEFAPHAANLLSGPGFKVRIRFAEETLRCTDRKELAKNAHHQISSMLTELRESWT